MGDCISATGVEKYDDYDVSIFHTLSVAVSHFVTFFVVHRDVVLSLFVSHKIVLSLFHSFIHTINSGKNYPKVSYE